MSEEDQRKWEIIIKAVITPLVAVVTVLVGIWQYTDSQKITLEREYELRKLERQEAAFNEKSALYKETRQILAFLASTTIVDSAVFESKVDRFWELYWGDLAAVESKEVESLMVQFANYLSDLKMSDAPETDSTRANLKQIALSFSHQTRKELMED
jgi:hypothetical protein